MSYCVNCGVELDKTARRCPLCGTPVYNPACPPETESDPYFPTRKVPVSPVSRRELVLLLTGMLASVALCCSVVNLFLGREVAWSLYVTGAACMLWIWFVGPLLVHKMPIWVRLTLDVLAVGLYVYIISIATDGAGWFRGLALPLVLWATLLVAALGFLLRGNRRSLLTAFALDVLALGLFVLGVEYWVDTFLAGLWQPGWSMAVFTACIALVIPLVIVRCVPSLREEARRRFHL